MRVQAVPTAGSAMRIALLASLCVMSLAALSSDRVGHATQEQLALEIGQVLDDLKSLAPRPPPATSSYAFAEGLKGVGVAEPSTDALRTQTGAVMAKALALWQKMGPGGLYENAAAELLSRQQQKNALRATCADIQKDIQDSGASLMASSNTTECSLASLEWLGGKSVEALTSKMSEADINSLKSKLSKECSMTGQQTSDSCGEKSALAVLTKLSRKYKDESKTTLDSCMIDGTKASTILRSVGMYSELVCLKDGATFCLAKVAGVDINQLATLMSSPSKESMDQICDPCVRKYFKFIMMIFAATIEDSSSSIATAADVLDAIFNMICSKDMDGNYCMLDSMIKEAQDSDNMNAGKIMCKPGGCGLKMMGFMADFHLAQECAKSKTDCDAASAVVAQKTLFLSAGCFKKDNKYCMDYITEGPPKWDEVVKSCGFPEDPSSTIAETLGTTCSDTCKATWQSLVDNWGCCAPTMAITIQKTFDNAITKQSTSCNIANGPGYCQGGTPRSFSIEVSNLAYSWYEASANKKRVESLVRDALFVAYGVPKKLVTVTGAKMADGGTKLTVNIEFQNEEAGSKFQTVFENTYASSRRGAQKLDLSDFERLPASARRDPTAKVSPTVKNEKMKTGTANLLASAGVSTSPMKSLSTLVAVLMLAIGFF